MSAQAHSLLHKEMNLLWNLEMTEMAAVYIHTYKLVCMLPQLYTYLVTPPESRMTPYDDE